MNKKSKIPKVAIVGRANVGKSTLWNRLSETGRAVVSDRPHTTRDRNYAPCLWRGKEILIIDTGGMDTEKDEIGRGIRKQAEHAIKEADMVLFIVDAKAGIVQADKELAKELKRLNDKTILVANKTDASNILGEALGGEVWSLGLGEPSAISAKNGRGIGDMLDRVYINLEKMGKKPIEPEETKALKIVIMGRPNVGKSSLMNAITGEERSIVSPIAHTTREPLDTELDWQGERVILVDTAGMRKRANIKERIEHDAIERNREALRRADVAVLVLDALEDPAKQDKHLAGLLKEANRGLIVVVNKWDLVGSKDSKTADKFADLVRYRLPFLAWAPIIFTSAKTGQRAKEIINLAFKVKEERQRVIADNALAKLLKFCIAKHPIRANKGNKSPYVYEVIQTATEPPTFRMVIRGVKIMPHLSWIKFFENQLRNKFGYDGTPIVINPEFDVTPLPQKTGPNKRKRPIGRKGFRY